MEKASFVVEAHAQISEKEGAQDNQKVPQIILDEKVGDGDSQTDADIDIQKNVTNLIYT